jgi:hypothetical protein
MSISDDPLRAVLLQDGDRVSRRDQRRLRLPGGHDTLWIGVLSEGHGVRQPRLLDVCDQGGRLHPGPVGVWEYVLLVGAGVLWRGLRLAVGLYGRWRQLCRITGVFLPEQPQLPLRRHHRRPAGLYAGVLWVSLHQFC